MKRYISEHQIVEVIDRYSREAQELRSKGDEIDAEADALRNSDIAYQIPEMRDEADACRRRAKWREGRLTMLKEKLAEFRTMPMPFIEEGSVPV